MYFEFPGAVGVGTLSSPVREPPKALGRALNGAWPAGSTQHRQQQQATLQAHHGAGLHLPSVGVLRGGRPEQHGGQIMKDGRPLPFEVLLV